MKSLFVDYFSDEVIGIPFSECSTSAEQRHGHCAAFSLCMHTDRGLLLPGNSCLLGYHRAAEYVVQRSTRRADETNAPPE